MNTPPGGSPTLMTVSYGYKEGSALTNGGLKGFGIAALTFPAADEADTVMIGVTIQGGVASKDINITIAADPNAMLDNYSSDSITYVAMPDTVASFVSSTGVIPKGKTYVEFQVIFHPNKIDVSKNFMLAVTATNDAGIVSSGNLSHIYFHTIGNPIAGGYNWDFIRCSTPTCSAGPDGNSFAGKTTVLAPANPTFVKVPTGYYDHANYFITFKNSAGVLSNFKAVIDPASVTGAWADAGIQIVTGPTILVENNNTKFTCNFTTLTRNCTDIYYK